MLPKSYVREVWNKAVMPVLDFFTIIAFAILTYQLRYEWQLSWLTDSEIISKTRVTNFKDYMRVSIVFAVICVIYFALNGLYKIRRKLTLSSELITISLGVLTVMGWVIVFLFFNEYNNTINIFNSIKLSKFLALFGTLFIILGLFFQRLVIKFITYIIRLNGVFENNVMIIGDHPEMVSNSLIYTPYIVIKKIYDTVDQTDFEDIKELIEQDKVQEIYINNRVENCLDIILLCERYKIRTQIYDADLFALRDIALRPNYINNNLYFELRYSALEGWGVVAKRIFDIIFSVLFLVIFSWVYFIIIIAIYLEDKGNPFYKSERIGPDGKTFNVFKFRRLKMEYCTTSDNAKALEYEQKLIQEKDMKNDGVLYKIHDDPRTTKIGRFLEKTSLDELPQFYNVLLGNLSVVGPRPHQPREVAKYLPHHFKVLNIKPGITGLAQINGRSDLSFDQEVMFDSEYVNKWSFWLDILIIFKTPFMLMKGHKN
jgi:exopolysaccharide biosynthesis polyprenyl glycosylphosphotransferase